MTTNRSWVYWDRYMGMQIAREHRLKPVERVVLEQVTLLADIREKTWTGNATGLGQEIHVSWRSTNDAIKKLVSEGLFLEEEPFGRNRDGRVRVMVYDLLSPDKAARAGGAQPYSRESAGIAQSQPQSKSRESADIHPFTDEPDSRVIPALFPRHSRASPANARISPANKSVLLESKDSVGSRRTGEGVCLQCNQPTDGNHPFDHEPVCEILNSAPRNEIEEPEHCPRGKTIGEVRPDLFRKTRESISDGQEMELEF